MMPKEQVATKMAQYGFGTRLRAVTMHEAREQVVDALAAEGFGVLTEIDVQATLKAKLGVDSAPYIILGACNPNIARQALAIEPYIGLLLPCNVTLWQEDDEIVVTFGNPDALLGLADDPRLGPIALEAQRRLRGALARILT